MPNRWPARAVAPTSCCARRGTTRPAAAPRSAVPPCSWGRGASCRSKGLGGYHLAYDATARSAVGALRRRKYRKEKPFAVMARDLETAAALVELSSAAEELLVDPARPIVLAPARRRLAEVAPGNRDLGVMLPYTPLHYLLFEAGAPHALVMTSANRSSEPIVYRDGDAAERLAGLADAFLIGEWPIARRVDDSVARAGVLGPVILRRARGHASGTVARLPTTRPMPALGAGGEAIVSQHIGDLSHYEAFEAFRRTVADLLAMYEVDEEDLLVVHDLHPGYASTRHAWMMPARARVGVQHHRAYLASVLAERGAFEERVIGVIFDGTGYGDDGAIWGGELFAGSLAEGFERAAHLRPAALPRGRCRRPLAGADSGRLPGGGRRSPRSGRAAVLLSSALSPCPGAGGEGGADLPDNLGGATVRHRRGAPRLHPRDHLRGPGGDLARAAGAQLVVVRRLRGRRPGRRDRLSPPAGSGDRRSPARRRDCRRRARLSPRSGAGDRRRGTAAVRPASGHHRRAFGGVFQNELLVAEVACALRSSSIRVWSNRRVPPNDGGVSLGQAALVAVAGNGEGACAG